jgi:hypothetical protein
MENVSQSKSGSRRKPLIFHRFQRPRGYRTCSGLEQRLPSGAVTRIGYPRFAIPKNTKLLSVARELQTPTQPGGIPPLLQSAHRYMSHWTHSRLLVHMMRWLPRAEDVLAQARKSFAPFWMPLRAKRRTSPNCGPRPSRAKRFTVSTPDARIVLLGEHEHFAPPRTAGQSPIWINPGMYGSSLGARSGTSRYFAKLG